VSTTEELLDRKISGSCLEKREYGRRDPSRWPRSTLYPQKLAITSLTSGGRSVGIVSSRTQTMNFSFIYIYIYIYIWNYIFFHLGFQALTAVVMFLRNISLPFQGRKIGQARKRDSRSQAEPPLCPISDFLCLLRAFTLLLCLAYSLALKMETKCKFETLFYIKNGLNGVASQKTVSLKILGCILIIFPITICFF
jgi:hypothetical protein